MSETKKTIPVDYSFWKKKFILPEETELNFDDLQISKEKLEDSLSTISEKIIPLYKKYMSIFITLILIFAFLTLGITLWPFNNENNKKSIQVKNSIAVFARYEPTNFIFALKGIPKEDKEIFLDLVDESGIPVNVFFDDPSEEEIKEYFKSHRINYIHIEKMKEEKLKLVCDLLKKSKRNAIFAGYETDSSNLKYLKNCNKELISKEFIKEDRLSMIKLYIIPSITIGYVLVSMFFIVLQYREYRKVAVFVNKMSKLEYESFGIKISFDYSAYVRIWISYEIFNPDITV